MLASAVKLFDRRVHASDGDLGRLEDIYFDDLAWKIIYFVVNISTWLPGKRVLVFPERVSVPNKKRDRITISMTMDQIKDSPGIFADPPVSLQEKIDPGRYPIWAAREKPIGAYLEGEAVTLPESAAASEGGGERHENPHLRSAREVIGYELHAHDGNVGRVHDILFETDEPWPIRYMVVRAHKHIRSHKVLISPQWVVRVEWPDSRIYAAMSREEIRQAPEYDESRHLTREYEEELHAYFGKGGYWPDES